MSVGLLCHHVDQLATSSATPVEGDWRHYELIAADPDHLSLAIGRIIRQGLRAGVLPLTGNADVDQRRLGNQHRPAPKGTLRVFNSSQPQRQYGFQLGLGALFHHVDHGRAGWLKGLRGALNTVPGKVAVDGEILGERFALAGVSADAHFPMKLRAPKEPSATQVAYLWNDLEGTGWMRQALATIRGLQKMKSHRAGVAHEVRFDIHDIGYALDGALHVVQAPCVLSVTRGPDIMVCL